jgi:hypothetical protein
LFGHSHCPLNFLTRLKTTMLRGGAIRARVWAYAF